KKCSIACARFLIFLDFILSLLYQSFLHTGRGYISIVLYSTQFNNQILSKMMTSVWIRFFLTKKSVGLELFPNPHYDFYSIIFRTNKCLFLYTITVTIASITPETKKTLLTPTQSTNIPITRDATPNTPVETALKDV